MSGTVGAHNDLHSEQGALPGEHPGRSRNPVIKVADIAWLEFEKPDLDRAEAFARAFGFTTVARTPDELQLRGTDAGAPCVLLRRGAAVAIRRHRVPGRRRGRRAAAGRRHRRARRSRCRSPSAASAVDLDRPQRHAGPRRRGHARAARARPQQPHVVQLRTRTQPHQRRRSARRACPPGAAARPRRAADHQVHRGAELVPRQPRHDRQRLPVLPGPARPRADDELHPLRPRLGTPTDHHTLALALGPANRYVHSAYQVCDLDALAAGGEYLSERGLFPVLGHRPPHPGQPDLRLLARSRTASWSSTSPTATCSTTPSNRAGRRSPPPAWPSGGRRPPRTSSASTPIALRTKRSRCSPHFATTTNSTSHRLRRPTESSQLMTISVLRTADAWWVANPHWRSRNRDHRDHHR